MLYLRLFLFSALCCMSLACAEQSELKTETLGCSQDSKFVSAIEGGVLLDKLSVPKGYNLNKYHAHYTFDHYEIHGQSDVRTDVLDQGQFKDLSIFNGARYYLIAKFPYQEFIADGQSFERLTWCLDSIELADQDGLSTKYQLDASCCTYFDGKGSDGQPSKSLGPGGVMSIMFS